MLRAAVLTSCLALASIGRAEMASPSTSAPPPQVSRTLRTFDFKERDRGNDEDTPAGWVKVEGPGLPHYLHGQFDGSVSAAGHTSFRFDLNGGSITYRYPAGLIRVMP